MNELIFDAAFLSQLEQLSLQARFRASGQTGGVRKSRNTGSSVEFSDFREYIAGDDFRRIDWNAYGRFDRLFLKLFMEEKQTKVHLLLDLSASMDFGQPNKLIIAKRLTAVMAYLALAGYDRVSIFTLGDEVSAELSSFSGKQGFMKVINFLENAETQKKTALSAAIKKLPIKQSHGISIVLSDLFSSDGYEEGIKYLQYCKQEVSVLQILSPEELKPPLEGRVRLLSNEDEEPCDVDINSATLRAYDRALQDFLDNAQKFCHGRRIPHVLIPTELDFEQMVFERILSSGVVR